MAEGLAEWIVTAPAGEKMALQMAYFDRGREPVVMEIGPVLDLEDVVGGKVAALASRAYERDYADTAAALEHYSPPQLIGFARRLDPGLTGQDFADAGQRLDQIPDEAFTAFGLTQQDVTALRERFAAWPRDAEAAEAAEAAGGEIQADEAAKQGPEQYEDEPAPGAGQPQREEERAAEAD